jgi:predicted RNA polymerase sigma factor
VAGVRGLDSVSGTVRILRVTHRPAGGSSAPVSARPRAADGFLGDLDLAEEAAQEAFATASQRWPRDGTPPNPGAWLTVTARNRAIDRLRRDRTLAEKTRLLDVPEAVEDEMEERIFPEERLELTWELVRITRSQVVELNRAIAVAKAEGTC